MKTLRCMCKFALLLLWCLALDEQGCRPANEKPVGGWDHARWGMTAGEIKASYPNAKDERRDSHDFGGRKYYSNLGLEPVRIGNLDFHVRFLMDDSDRLAAVQLYKMFEKPTDAKAAYDVTRDLLIQKYGNSAEEQDEPDDPIKRSGGTLLSSIWHSDKALVKLRYVSLPLYSTSTVFVNYTKPVEADNL
jgi:hypothetical protein